MFAHFSISLWGKHLCDGLFWPVGTDSLATFYLHRSVRKGAIALGERKRPFWLRTVGRW